MNVVVTRLDSRNVSIINQGSQAQIPTTIGLDDISTIRMHDLLDVSEDTLLSGSVPRYNANNHKYEVTKLTVSDIDLTTFMVDGGQF